MALFTLVFNIIGLMALVAMCVGSIERMNVSPMAKTLARGAPYGLAACIAILSPAVMPDGTVANGRSVFLAFSAAFGGLAPFITATAITTTGLTQLTGMELANTVRPTLAAGALGLAWNIFVFPRLGLRVVSLLILGLMVSALALLVLLAPSGHRPQLLLQVYPFSLVASVVAALILGRFIERELRHFARERLWQQEAYSDALTGLANKRAFFEATSAVAKASDTYSIFVIDVDHFKRVNDTYGHDAGDAVLKAVANAIAASIPANGKAFRLGGEEFVVVLKQVRKAQAHRHAEAIRNAIGALAVEVDSNTLTVTASVGIADSSEGAAASSVLAAADAALYRAKDGGRNRTEIG